MHACEYQYYMCQHCGRPHSILTRLLVAQIAAHGAVTFCCSHCGENAGINPLEVIGCVLTEALMEQDNA